MDGNGELKLLRKFKFFFSFFFFFGGGGSGHRVGESGWM